MNDLYADCRSWNPVAYHEIAVDDCYHMAEVVESPELVIDIGANRGVFTACARRRWPDAQVWSVEPYQPNFEHLVRQFSADDRVYLFRNALSAGGDVFWFDAGPELTGNHSYRTASRWLPTPAEYSAKPCTVAGLSLATWANDIESQRTFVKIDCEGAESCLLADPQSMLALRGASWIAMELHWFAATKPLSYDLAGRWVEALVGFEESHTVRLTIHESGGYAWLIRRR